MIKLLIADDQTLMRDGLKTILELEPNIEVVGTAANGSEAVDKCDTLAPDVVLMDIRMPVLNGVDATKQIRQRHPHTAVLVLTTFDDEEYIIEALQNGAAGYILKDIDADKLISAIADAASGNFILPSAIAAKLAGRLKASVNQSIDFTQREHDVAQLLMQGRTNKQISAALYLSEGTVKNHVSSIYSKLQIFDRTAAAVALGKMINAN